jgi:hypothetical protein
MQNEDKLKELHIMLESERLKALDSYLKFSIDLDQICNDISDQEKRLYRKEGLQCIEDAYAQMKALITTEFITRELIILQQKTA